MIVFIIIVLLLTTSGIQATVLERYSHLQCNACRAITKVIHKRLQESSPQSTFQPGHRLNKSNSLQRKNYSGSELQAIEVLESLCSEMSKCYLYESKSNHTRYFVWNETLSEEVAKRGVTHFDKFEGEYLTGTHDSCKKICQHLVGEYEEVLVRKIRENAEASQEHLANVICSNELDICNHNRNKKDEELEARRRLNYLKKKRNDNSVEVPSQRETDEAKPAETPLPPPIHEL